MKMTLVKKSGGFGRLSARDVPEEKAVWFCRTNEKGVRLVTVSGNWDTIEDLYA
jgi:hypothetical protein